MLIFPEDAKVCFNWCVDLNRSFYKDYQDREEGDISWEQLYLRVTDTIYVNVQLLSSKTVTVTDESSQLNGKSLTGGIQIYGDPVGKYEEV